MTPYPDPLSPQSLHVRFLPHENYLEAVIEGFASLPSAQAVLAQTGEEAARLGMARVLINCLGILGQTSQYDHAQLGATLAAHLGHLRSALLTAPTKIQGVLGTTARSAGADYRAFSNRADAVAWLCA